MKFHNYIGQKVEITRKNGEIIKGEVKTISAIVKTTCPHPEDHIDSITIETKNGIEAIGVYEIEKIETINE
ncbi:hypothetical protein GPL06_03820 [Bacteroides salyersiae]|uniref:hypothetical protein n=2 Tax=Bacteroides salyersiae TaxID=291644 RepID=UPI001B8D551D|nr:hypothetical protein [Bacteroides salyersiae]MBT9871955.1 hypothetical protein [Bacteroides salyersiae]MCS2404481.1 hypothetical protein [Bacteroides salyersiae]QUT76132.1 hypothetical protein INE81_02606 [Bacteroides salyersiae]